MTRTSTALGWILAVVALALAAPAAAGAQSWERMFARVLAVEAELPGQGPIFFEAGTEIVALDRDASEPRRITAGREPAISRDGTRLAFVRDDEKEGPTSCWSPAPTAATPGRC